MFYGITLIKYVITTLKTIEVEEEDEDEDCPDVGFAFDPNGQSCAVSDYKWKYWFYLNKT